MQGLPLRWHAWAAPWPPGIDAALADAAGQVQRAHVELAAMRQELVKQVVEGEERGRRQGEQARQNVAEMQVAGAAAQVQQLQGALGA